MSKYGNKKVTCDGYVFDSKAEHRRYQELRLLEQAGEILELQVHPSFELMPAFRDRSGKRYAAIRYEADFQYVERSAQGYAVVEDVKGRGVITPVFRIKEKLFRRWYTHLDLRIIEV